MRHLRMARDFYAKSGRRLVGRYGPGTSNKLHVLEVACNAQVFFMALPEDAVCHGGGSIGFDGAPIEPKPRQGRHPEGNSRQLFAFATLRRGERLAAEPVAFLRVAAFF